MSTTSSDNRSNPAGAAARQGADKLYSEVEKIQSELKALGAKVGEIAGEGFNRVQDGTAEGIHETGEIVRRNPFAALAIAVGLGLLLGAILRR